MRQDTKGEQPIHADLNKLADLIEHYPQHSICIIINSPGGHIPPIDKIDPAESVPYAELKEIDEE